MAIGTSNYHIACEIEMYLLQGVKTLALVKTVSHDTLIEICCFAGLCRIVLMSYFLGNDATSIIAFYFIGYLQRLSWFFSLPEADMYIAIIVLTDVKLYETKKNIGSRRSGDSSLA
jgi:hypothetical protein